MDWNAAIERNREALKRILASLVAMTAPACGGDPVFSAGSDHPNTLPRRLHRAVLRLLRPAEAAARRLIIVMARGIKVSPSSPRLTPPRQRIPESGRKGTLKPQRSVPRKPSFPLFDPLRLPVRRRLPQIGVPRISVPGFSVPFPLRKPPSADDPLNAARLVLRLQALASALDDLPARARRFARLRAHRVRPSG